MLLHESIFIITYLLVSKLQNSFTSVSIICVFLVYNFRIQSFNFVIISIDRYLILFRVTSNRLYRDFIALISIVFARLYNVKKKKIFYHKNIDTVTRIIMICHVPI